MCRGDSGAKTCYDKCPSAIWQRFVSNCSAGPQASGTKAKALFLNSSIASIAFSKWSRWPYQDSYAQSLDHIHRGMISILVQIRARPGEAFQDFTTRRTWLLGEWHRGLVNGARAEPPVSDICMTTSSGSIFPNTCSAAMVDWHDTAWLEPQHLLAGSLAGSRTNTREMGGGSQQSNVRALAGWQGPLRESPSFYNVCFPCSRPARPCECLFFEHVRSPVV